MIKTLVCLLLVLRLPVLSEAQDTINIPEIQLTSSLIKQTLLRTPAAAAIIDSGQLKLQTSVSLLPAFNAVPGIRMEERSPGSYRLSLRGSLLRSPFGVRDVKIYLDEYPLTDASGNTYINVLAMQHISRVEILKGPDGSLFGANSGGIVNFFSNREKKTTAVEMTGGSFGLFRENILLVRQKHRHTLNIYESYQRSDGYRDNSKLHRFNLHVNENWQYSKKNSLKMMIFYSDLYYQTPGGLTQKQYDSFPSQARPATATLPGSATQKAAVYNKMFFAGITHIAFINKYIDHTISIFGSGVNFKNPFITNYETRKEGTYGLRTFFSFSNNHIPNKIHWENLTGFEWQQTRSAISNYANVQGNKAALLAAGNIRTDQHFLFSRVKIDLDKILIAEAGISWNFYSYRFNDSTSFQNHFDPQWMPRIAISFTPVKMFTIRSSISKGYSPPTTTEFRPVDSVYKDLQAETGTNIEAGVRFFSRSNRFWLDVSLYRYRLKNAIVPQQDSDGNNYFVNAGSTNQKGLEIQLSWMIISPDQNKKLFKKILLNNSSSIINYRFDHYITGTANYSGNHITGVPGETIVSSIMLELKTSTYFFIQHNYTAEIPLNDANSFYAKDYDLIQIKVGHNFKLGSFMMDAYVGADNLLNERYSLGNDLNAAGNRFYNAAATRNYFLGVVLSYLK